MRSRLVPCLMTVAVLAAGGCTAGGSKQAPDTGEPAVSTLLHVSDLRTFTLPLEPYRESSATLPRSAQAQQVLIEKCVQRFGLRYTPPAEAGSSVVGAERRYGIADAAAAREHGYHVPPPSGRPAPETKPPPDTVAVLFGDGPSRHNGQAVPEGGCVGEARRKLAAGAPAVGDARLAEELSAETFDQAWRHSRARTAVTAWSACMRQAGYDYADPLKANDDPAFRTPEPTAREIAVARADVTCKEQSDLVDVLASVETAYQDRAVRRHAAELATLKESFAVRERNAARVLAGS
ncbi:hypothetical protein AB0J80_06800 [Actinoplanes sp. NPDC049548]|uniref:hypothetical protein n=1 Tax=Actinoplanes sp. NPDC049548 TaxID=3155152 RepID=UPI0034263AEF